MYAVIKTGGKQYRVAVGDIIDIELIKAEPGTKFEFADVLFAYDGSKTYIGKPAISNYLVYGEILGQVKGDKLITLKYKASHNQCRKWGHRQKYTRVRIAGIESNHQKKGDKHGT